MILTSDRAWPPRRLPSRLRLARILLSRARPGRGLRLAAGRLALWMAWLAAAGAAFLLIDLYL